MWGNPRRNGLFRLAAGRGVARGAGGAPLPVRYLVGVHPYGTADYTDAVHAQVEAALDDPWCAGVGEVGLDYHFDADDDIEAAPHELQMDVMARQVELAVCRNVPVELHLRNDTGDAARQAHADAARVLEQVGVPRAGCVLHCFGEDRATMERFVDLGCHVAFGGAATFRRNDEVREAFAVCPLDRLLLETDCPLHGARADPRSRMRACHDCADGGHARVRPLRPYGRAPEHDRPGIVGQLGRPLWVKGGVAICNT